MWKILITIFIGVTSVLCAKETEVMDLAISTVTCAMGVADPLTATACGIGFVYGFLSGNLFSSSKVEWKHDLLMLTQSKKCERIVIPRATYYEICTRRGERLGLGIIKAGLHNCYKYNDPVARDSGECCGVSWLDFDPVNVLEEHSVVDACSGKFDDRSIMSIDMLIAAGAVGDVGPSAYKPLTIAKSRLIHKDQIDYDELAEGRRGSVSPSDENDIKYIINKISEVRPSVNVQIKSNGARCEIFMKDGPKSLDSICPYYTDHPELLIKDLKVPCCVIPEGSDQCDYKAIGVYEVCQ